MLHYCTHYDELCYIVTLTCDLLTLNSSQEFLCKWWKSVSNLYNVLLYDTYNTDKMCINLVINAIKRINRSTALIFKLTLKSKVHSDASGHAISRQNIWQFSGGPSFCTFNISPFRTAALPSLKSLPYHSQNLRVTVLLAYNTFKSNDCTCWKLKQQYCLGK